MSYACADYLAKALKPPSTKRIADLTATLIEQKINPSSYECIVFRGLSGALIAPIVAYKLGRPCVPVRKGENSHSDYSVELAGDYQKYIIIDDLISSGATCVDIIDVCEGHSMECVGIVLYNEVVWYQYDMEANQMQENLFYRNTSCSSADTYPVYCVGKVDEYCV